MPGWTGSERKRQSDRAVGFDSIRKYGVTDISLYGLDV